jgi:hypothetical protein
MRGGEVKGKAVGKRTNDGRSVSTHHSNINVHHTGVSGKTLF